MKDFFSFGIIGSGKNWTLMHVYRIVIVFNIESKWNVEGKTKNSNWFFMNQQNNLEVTKKVCIFVGVNAEIASYYV